MNTDRHKLNRGNWQKILIESLIFIAVLASGRLGVDCIQHRTASVFLQFLEKKSHQIKTDLQTIESVRKNRERIRDRMIVTDAPIILLALFGLWCVPRMLKENSSRAVKDK
jgi:hypothetical protein